MNKIIALPKGLIHERPLIEIYKEEYEELINKGLTMEEIQDFYRLGE